MNEWQQAVFGRGPHDYRKQRIDPQVNMRHANIQGRSFNCSLTVDMDDVDEYPCWHAAAMTNPKTSTDLWPMALYQNAVRVCTGALVGVGMGNDRIDRGDFGAHVRRKLSADEVEAWRSGKPV